MASPSAQEQHKETVRQIERELGRKLTKDELRRLHDAITRQKMGMDEIIELGLDMFGG